MKQKDGIRIPSDVLEKNAIELKKIAQTKPRVISLQTWISASSAVVAVLVIAILWNIQPSADTDSSLKALNSLDLVDAYESGIVDFDIDMVIEYASPDDFQPVELETELDATNEELNQLLDELSDEEILNYLNS